MSLAHTRRSHQQQPPINVRIVSDQTPCSFIGNILRTVWLVLERIERALRISTGNARCIQKCSAGILRLTTTRPSAFARPYLHPLAKTNLATRSLSRTV